MIIDRVLLLVTLPLAKRSGPRGQFARPSTLRAGDAVILPSCEVVELGLCGSRGRPRGVGRRIDTTPWFQRLLEWASASDMRLTGRCGSGAVYTCRIEEEMGIFETKDHTDKQPSPGVIESYHEGKACRISPSETPLILLESPCDSQVATSPDRGCSSVTKRKQVGAHRKSRHRSSIA
ncbi:hypothetical protein THAOC_16104 [Thalassiosira oceanica]|uniref:Uncharacterized protein n=1 Tax=Thalassiosira oceanica TaxID=159749 RepID=K0SAZ1_THAOC|nr:hypothetical protein THAOC_16104 [Thalassiosira oceanica]|eukprot:EJK63253.1 hypothetical protein THAOC_16104 [Thalassiosira oceanica]